MSKLGKEGQNGHFEFVLNDNKTNSYNTHLLKLTKRREKGELKGVAAVT